MGAFKEILKMTWRFYRHECCFPYTLSFLLVLLIYITDFHILEKTMLWPSIISYGIITGYYVQILSYYRRKVLFSDNPKFFILILGFKILLWGIILFTLITFYK